MLKQIILWIILAVQPVFLSGQPMGGERANSLFSTMDRVFNDFNDAENAFTPENEYYLGRAVAANILMSYKPYTVNPELTNYLNLICQALVINCAEPAAYNNYHVMILDSPELNAFSTPGGHIFITIGLVRAASSEDALAGIIAHELAHVMLKHGIKIINDMKITNEADIMAGQAAAFAGNSNAGILTFSDSVNEIFYSMIKSGYSAPQEFEADSSAVTMLAAAGYNASGLLEILNILKTVQGSQNASITSTHPSSAERIANVERQIALNRAPDTRSFRQERFNRIMKK